MPKITPTLSEIIKNILSDLFKKKIGDFHDKQKIEKFKEDLFNCIIEYEQGKDGTIIVTDVFFSYVKYYNLIEEVIDYVFSSNVECSEEKYKSKLVSEIQKYVKKDKNYKESDNKIIKEFVDFLFKKVSKFSESFLNESDKKLLHCIIEKHRETMQMFNKNHRETIEVIKRVKEELRENDSKKCKLWSYSLPSVSEKHMEYREEYIEKINEYFGGNNNYLFLYGEHGIGKTILARSFAKRYFDEKAIFVKYTNSFKETVASLSKYLFDEEYVKEKKDNLYDAVLYELRRQQKKLTENWLVIIDNCNSDKKGTEQDDDRIISEFRGDDFNEFVSTGINVLFTTTIRESFSDNGMEVGTISKLYELYEQKSGCEVTDTAKEVINAVKENTLLVTLIASMIKTKRDKSEEMLTELRDKFATLEVEEVKIKVEDQDGRVKKRDTIYNHLRVVFNLAEINGVEWNAMEEIVLISNEGISKSDFYELTNNKFEDEIQMLINKSWICEDELVNKGQWLSVHPLVREIIIKSEKYDYKDCLDFLNNLLDVVTKEKKENMYNVIKYSETMYQIFQLLKRKKELVIWEIGYLLTEIYEETYFQYDRVYWIAFDILKEIKVWEPESLRNKIKRCRMINGSAYSLLHTNTKELELKMEECKNAKENLDFARVELQNIEVKSDTEENYEKRIVEALIHGNMGAYYREMALFGQNVENNLEHALKEHREGLECREKLLKEYPEKKDRIDGLIATSYHCIGRDYFSMGNYKCALDNHIKAEELRRSLYQKNRENGQKDKWMQSCNMICSTIINMGKEAEKQLDTFCKKFEMLKKFYWEQKDRKGLEDILRIFGEISEHFDLQKYDRNPSIGDIREYLQ